VEPLRKLKWMVGPYIPFAYELYSDSYISLNYHYFVHEAGHAVLNEHLGYAVQSVEIKGENGVTTAAPSQDNAHRIVIAYAGVVASRRVIDEVATREWASHDFWEIHHIFDGMAMRPEEWHSLNQTHEATCEGIIDQRWEQVEAIASALAIKRCLLGEEVRAIIEQT